MYCIYRLTEIAVNPESTDLLHFPAVKNKMFAILFNFCSMLENVRIRVSESQVMDFTKSYFTVLSPIINQSISRGR